MEQLIEFLGNNLILTAALAVIVIAIIVTEVRRVQSGGTEVDTGEATVLYNRHDALFVDIRGESEFRKAHLPGAVNVPGTSIDKGLGKLARHKDRPIIVYCNTGMQTGKVVKRLRQEGFPQARQLKGGLTAWQGAGFPLEGK